VPPTYADFPLGIELGAHGYQVRAFPPGAEAESPAELPFGPEELPEILERLHAWESTSPLNLRDLKIASGPEAPPHLKEIGRGLFKVLFSGKVGDLYASRWNSAREAGQGLRVRIHLRPENPALAWLSRVPWELLYDDRTGSFLALNPLNPVVRHLELAQSVARASFRAPIKVLLVAANPAGVAELDLEGEQERIGSSWRQGKRRVEIKVLAGASPDDLRREIRRGGYQILHFMGHGLAEGEGGLLFSTPEGHPRLFTGEQMAQLFQGIPATRLVILNACRSAAVPAGEDADPLSGVAAALVRGGQPEVVGMQFPISDPAALVFSQTLYEGLADGEPIEAAMAEARLAIFTVSPRPADWLAPVLFLRGAEVAAKGGSLDRNAGRKKPGIPTQEANADLGVVQAKNVELSAMDSCGPKLPTTSTRLSLKSEIVSAEETFSLSALRIRNSRKS
jgi:hypothetical protein